MKYIQYQYCVANHFSRLSIVKHFGHQCHFDICVISTLCQLDINTKSMRQIHICRNQWKETTYKKFVRSQWPDEKSDYTPCAERNAISEVPYLHSSCDRLRGKLHKLVFTDMAYYAECALFMNRQKQSTEKNAKVTEASEWDILLPNHQFTHQESRTRTLPTHVPVNITQCTF